MLTKPSVIISIYANNFFELLFLREHPLRQIPDALFSSMRPIFRFWQMESAEHGGRGTIVRRWGCWNCVMRYLFGPCIMWYTFLIQLPEDLPGFDPPKKPTSYWPPWGGVVSVRALPGLTYRRQAASWRVFCPPARPFGPACSSIDSFCSALWLQPLLTVQTSHMFQHMAILLCEIMKCGI